MHSRRDRCNRLRDEFREEANRTIDEKRILEKQLADALGVDQSTVHRWLVYDFEDKADFPASLVPALLEEYPELALTMLRFQARAMHCQIIPLLSHGPLNGSILDEVLTLSQFTGRLAGAVKEGRLDSHKCENSLLAIREAADQALVEIAGFHTTQRMGD